MLFRAVVAATAFTGLVLAQNSSTQTSQYTVPASEIDANTRSTWCTSQQNICNPICGGLAYPNTCDPTTLIWSCVCSDHSNPNISSYQGTIPSNLCSQWKADCIQQYAADASLQQEMCKTVICGNATVDAVSSSSSAAASTSATQAPSSTSGSPASTTSGSGAAASASKGAAIADVAFNYGTGALAAGMLGLFGLAL